MIRLPVDGGDTCFTCPAPCCTSYLVPIHGYDLWRLVNGLQLPWREVATLLPEQPGREGFALDGSEARLGLFLRHREGEVCRFLLTLPGGQQRCGAHGARPMACRVYPWKPSDNNQLGLEIAGHAMCPEAQRAHFAGQMRQARAGIYDELAERPLYQLAVARWNQHVQTRFAGPDEFVGWILQLYDAMLPLRRQPDWQLQGPRFVIEFPL